nr:hypothetical protein [Tanacetum cinerariifolium]
MYYEDIRPIFEAKFNANLKFLLKTKEQIEEEERRAIALINETPAQKAAKRRKLNKEAEDVEELKQHLEIVPDKDDDVFTEATLLARKDPVMDYQIIHVDNKPRYKIIHADDTHQLYRSFITMLKFFDREDLEKLWNIVKESFLAKASSILTCCFFFIGLDSSTIIPFPLSFDLVSAGVFVDDSSSRSLIITPLLLLVARTATLTGAGDIVTAVTGAGITAAALTVPL